LRRAFVDCHSHVVPSGDDGARSIGDGLELCADAAQHGTAMLFATPHVWPALPLTDERERAVRAGFDELRAQAPLELRLGFELTPTAALLREDLARYELQGTGAVLLDTPFVGPLNVLMDLAERAEAQGLRVILAHPERAEVTQAERYALEQLTERGWLLQVNGSSLLGYHGAAAEEVGWWLVEEGRAGLVASDGHRLSRPARLDGAFAAVEARVGEGATTLFDGSALGTAGRVTEAGEPVSGEPTRSPGASTGA
jgi:protein-tyrosine phosphatase